MDEAEVTSEQASKIVETNTMRSNSSKRKPGQGRVITRTVLNRDTKAIMNEMAVTHEPVVVVFHGRPEAIIQPISEQKLASLISEHASELVEERSEALQALDKGEALTTDEVFTE